MNLTAEDRCELLGRCLFVDKYKNSGDERYLRCRRMYCDNWFNSEDCARKEHVYTSECGCQPAANLSPDGTYYN